MNLLKSKLNEDAKKSIEHIVSDTIGTNICDPFMMLVEARESPKKIIAIVKLLTK